MLLCVCTILYLLIYFKKKKKCDVIGMFSRTLGEILDFWSD